MATKVALLSFEQKEPSFRKVGAFWNCFLTIKQEETLKRPFGDTLPPPNSCFFTQFVSGKVRGKLGPTLYSEDLSLLKESFMSRPVPC